jgi:hypothetical protein
MTFRIDNYFTKVAKIHGFSDLLGSLPIVNNINVINQGA